MDTVGPIVAIVGGAVSGAEAAKIFAEHDVPAVVFERERRPFGKVFAGLPRWHSKLRRQEFDRIISALDNPLIHLVPMTEIGEQLSIDRLLGEWEISAVVLANGAQRDRLLPVPRAASFVGKGLRYQNEFVRWFNELDDGDVDSHSRIVDGAVVIGGGLASVDVAKICQLENYRAALYARGHIVDLEKLEHRGIDKYCAEHALDPVDLAVRDVTIVYRRGMENMALVPFTPSNEAEEQKARKVRVRLMNQVIEKYRVKLLEYGSAVNLEGEERLKGIQISIERPGQGARIDTIATTLVVSAIGSLPSPIPGVPQKGELYHYSNPETGALHGLPRVYALGNVLTGKGNLRESRRSAKSVASFMAKRVLGHELSAEEADKFTTVSSDQVEAIIEELRDGPRAAILERVRTRQQEIGYQDLKSWLA